MTAKDLPGNRRRVDRTSGREYIHSMVATGSISWTDAQCKERQEELNFPPRKLTSTSAAHVGAAMLDNFESYLFGQKFPAALQGLATQFRSIGFHCVADSAAANIKVVRKLFSYLVQKGKDAGVVITCMFSPCLLHQLMRLVLLLMEHKALSPALFSITRLQLNSTAKQRTMDTMKALLEERFRYVPDSYPPDLPSTTTYFRRRLKELLRGGLDNIIEDDEDTFTQKATHIERLLDFFNGDLSNKMEWTHFCSGPGCHQSRQHALHDVPCLAHSWPFGVRSLVESGIESKSVDRLNIGMSIGWPYAGCIGTGHGGVNALGRGWPYALFNKKYVIWYL